MGGWFSCTANRLYFGWSPLTAIQTIVIICALPCTFVCIALVKSFIGMVKQDEKDGKFSLKTGWYNENGLTKEQKGE